MKAEDLKATYHEGVLELTAPMPKEALPKEVKVQIQSGEAKKPDGDKKAARRLSNRASRRRTKGPAA